MAETMVHSFVVLFIQSQLVSLALDTKVVNEYVPFDLHVIDKVLVSQCMDEY